MVVVRKRIDGTFVKRSYAGSNTDINDARIYKHIGYAKQSLPNYGVNPQTNRYEKRDWNEKYEAIEIEVVRKLLSES